MASGGKPPGKIVAPSLGVLVFTVQGRGLVVKSTTPGGLAEMYGLERGDVVTAVHGRPNPTIEDLKLATQGAFHPDCFTMQILGAKSNMQYGFEISLPLASPETHFHGMLMERDFEAGIHVITGVLQNSAAAKAGVRPGSCIRLIDGMLVGGLTDEDMRKMIFGGQSDVFVLGLQPPKMTTVSDFRFTRFVDTYVFIGDDGPGDDASYTDGWSDKQHDILESDPAVADWLRSHRRVEVVHAHPFDIPDFDESQVEAALAEEEADNLQPPQRSSGDAATLLRKGEGEFEKRVKERVERAIAAQLNDFLAGERRWIETETATIELEADNLRESLYAMIERLRIETGAFEESQDAEEDLQQQLIGVRNSIAFLLTSMGMADGDKAPDLGAHQRTWSPLAERGHGNIGGESSIQYEAQGAEV